MAKSQYNTIYGLLIIGLSFAIMIGVFVFSDIIKTGAVKNLGERTIDSVSDNIISSLVDISTLVNQTSPSKITQVVDIPQRIGEQNYFIRGENKTFTIRTIGRRSLVSETNITGIINASIFGTASSQGGRVTLDYNANSSVVMLS